MDLISLIGTILGFVVIIVGTILKGAHVSALVNPAAFVIVFVGTLAALLVQNSGAVLRHALKVAAMIYKPPQHRPEDLISRIVGWSEISRRQGLLGLEPQIDSEPDPFIKKGLQMLVDGGEPEAIRNVLEVDMETREAKDLAASKVYESAGIFSPTMGIIGAVMGLMAVMENLADPSKLGHGIAAAFVATIYGVALANMFMLPMAARLKSLIGKQTRMREILIEGLVSIAEGDNPRLIEARLQGYVS
ncbi:MULTISPECIES: flagellar motor protein [Rhodanobacter]|uniref:Flagellar motor protein n=1 Tax=Rhodanobacter hydrolyticus TaxID=2250595 RepID=A0ABW8JA57_9GAMM|nr:flagellar motor protein [Rhodanobacter sp. 7MK24]MBD8881935.1 flagellar motor protein [Rhodanobacter sp. 7MK24]